MSRSGQRRADAGALLGLPLAVVVLVGAQYLEGGGLRTLAQPTAALVVFGGTCAALLVSYPVSRLAGAARALVRAVFAVHQPGRDLVARLTEYANRVRRKGIFSLEPELGEPLDPFLKRGLELAVDGFKAADVRRLLEAESHTLEQEEEDHAELLESAAGYAPTLGILGAVLGLIHVMEHLAAPSKLGQGIAVAFVATVYGVGSANLLFLPLATKIRTNARASALRRHLIIEGIAAIQENQHPRMVDQQLTALLRRDRRSTPTAVVA